MKQLLILLLLAIPVFCVSLQPTYTLSTQDLNASAIFPDIKEDFNIYRFEKNKQQKSFSSSTLIKLFSEHDIKLDATKRGVIHFRRAATADLEPLKKKILAYYLSHYPTIDIKDIRLQLNGYTKGLPNHYELSFKPNAYQHKYSTVKLTSAESKKRHFISYDMSATIKLFKARHNINRGKILTHIDMAYEETPFKRLKGTPIHSLEKGQYRLKKRLPRGNIIYEHDIEPLPAVLKDTHVNVRFVKANVQLSFQATSLQDGNVGESIYIKRTDGKRLKAKVLSKDLVEIE